LNSTCGGTEWDGNFVNWATFRRFDAVKKSMSGGNCYHPTASPIRNADGTCKPYGTPSLPTVKAQNIGTGGEITPGIPRANANSDLNYVGRIPTAAHSGNPGTLYVHVEDDGDVCINDDNSGSCPDGDGFAETELNEIAFAMYSEPTGVIQQVGSKARFGLAVFNGNSVDDGLRVLTPIGSRQSINFSGTTVETFNTNTAAMIDSVDESFPETWTPLAETLYDAVRYIAQINSAYYPTSYVYPIAFSGAGSSGVAFGGSGAGSIGASEITVLTGSETCPSG
jgi:type IV pilus assembly protein PilY1